MLEYITDYYSKYCTVFPNYINLDTKQYFYKNIIRKQKCLNEKHNDIIMLKERGEYLEEGSPNKLLTSSYIQGLHDDEAMYSQYMQNVSSASSQILDFTLQSSQLSVADLSNSQADVANMGLKELFCALAGNKFDESDIIEEGKAGVNEAKVKILEPEIVKKTVVSSSKTKAKEYNMKMVKKATNSISNLIIHSTGKYSTQPHKRSPKKSVPLSENR
jgi:hypothetical protein